MSWSNDVRVSYMQKDNGNGTTIITVILWKCYMQKRGEY